MLCKRRENVNFVKNYIKMNDLVNIKSRIYEIRGQKIMLDRDLAELYGVETRVLNQAVKRNINRFPGDFMFQLTQEEFENWKSQIVISNSIKMGVRYLPYAFTELGVAMLSSVLKSDTAIQVNMGIMRAFVSVRQAISYVENSNHRIAQLEKDFAELKTDLEEIFCDYNDINEDTRFQLEMIKESLAELQANNRIKNKARRQVGFRPSLSEEETDL